MSVLKILVAVLLVFHLNAQVVNTGMTDEYDSLELGKIKFEGFVDTYYSYSFSNSAQKERNYAVSSTQLNEFNINLAYISVQYKNDKVRFKFIPGFGTYINANYSSEAGSLKFLIEGNVGVQLSQKKGIWLDAGVLASPFTNENALSKDHLMYIRSMGSDYVPYYLSGIRLTLPVSKKLNSYFYVVNGWQQIDNMNNGLAAIGQLEFRPTDKLLVNWDVYAGDERSDVQPNFRLRTFSDIYIIAQWNKKWSTTASLYFGNQQIKLIDKTVNYPWNQCNIVQAMTLPKGLTIALRGEYFNDPHKVMIQPQNSGSFSTFGIGSCLTYKTSQKSHVRLDIEHLKGRSTNFLSKNGTPISHSTQITCNLSVWF